MDDTDISGWTAPPPPPPPWEAPPPPLSPPPPPGGSRPGLLRRRTAVAVTLAGIAGGALVGGYAVTQAASTPSPSASATATPAPGDWHGHGGPAFGGPNDRAEDEQTIAGALGISTSQLETDLKNGQTIAAIAKAQNVDVNKVIAAIVTARDKEIDAALAAGSITQAQATQMKSDATQQATDQVNNTRPAGGPGHGGPRGLQTEDLNLVAGALGISASQLQTDLQNGQTIAAVAKAQNVDVNTVISAWVASENQEIDARVTAGQLTQAQATQEKQETQQRVTDEVNGTHPAFGGPHGAPGTNPSA